MVGSQRRARQERFEATGSAAPARRSRNLVRRWARHRIVPPFSRDCVGAYQDLPSDRYSASHTRPENDAEDRLNRGAGAVGRLGQGETVGIIGKSCGPPESALDIALQRASDQPNGVGVLDETGGGRDSARNADSDRCRCPDFLLDRAHQGDNRIDRRAIVLCRRGHAVAKTHRPARVYGGSFDLGAAKIDADAKPC